MRQKWAMRKRILFIQFWGYRKAVPPRMYDARTGNWLCCEEVVIYVIEVTLDLHEVSIGSCGEVVIYVIEITVDSHSVSIASICEEVVIYVIKVTLDLHGVSIDNFEEKWHPDKCATKGSTAVDSAKASESAKERFQDIQKAYSVLSDSNKRLMYDAGVYADDDDELEMSSFMGEMAAMMAASTKEVDATETLDELKAMFLNIADTDCHKQVTSKKRASDCLSQKADEKHWRSMPPSNRGSTHEDIFRRGFCSDAVTLDGGLNDLFEEGDAVDSLQELKQMFMNIVDPEFYASACSGKATSASLSQQNNESHWMNGSTAFDDLVAQTLFPDDRISGAGLEGSGFDSKISSTTFCSDVNGSTSIKEKKREDKKQKLCQGQNAISSPSGECDLSSTLSMDFNFYGGCSENEDWGSTYFL